MLGKNQTSFCQLVFLLSQNVCNELHVAFTCWRAEVLVESVRYYCVISWMCLSSKMNSFSSCIQQLRRFCIESEILISSILILSGSFLIILFSSFFSCCKRHKLRFVIYCWWMNEHFLTMIFIFFLLLYSLIYHSITANIIDVMRSIANIFISSLVLCGAAHIIIRSGEGREIRQYHESWLCAGLIHIRLVSARVNRRGRKLLLLPHSFGFFSVMSFVRQELIFWFFHKRAVLRKYRVCSSTY